MNTVNVKQIDYYETFPEYICGIGKKYGSKPALCCYDKKRNQIVLTYQELAEKCKNLAKNIIDSGFQGKHIALLGENSINWIISYLSIIASGNVAVCIDTEQSKENLVEMIQMSDSIAVFSSASCMEICNELLQNGKIEKIYSLDEKGPDSVASIVEQKVSEWEFPQSLPNQTAAIAFTSGTTSIPKMVMLSQKNILFNTGDSIVNVEAYDRVFSSLPCYHTYGITAAVLATLVRGAYLCINGNLRTFMRDIQLFDPESMLVVPLMIEAIHKQIWVNAESKGQAENLKKLLKSSAMKRKLGINSENKILHDMWKANFGSLKLFISGGAHLSLEIQEEFQEFGVQILQGYGITECSPLVSVNGNEKNRMGSVGLVMEHSKVRIHNEEIQVSGVNVMQGYYKDPEATKEVMDGIWFKTGDLGYIDKDGYIYITGRKKNLIVFKNGKKVSPEKLEELLLKIPQVKEVMVYGAQNGLSEDDVSLAASVFPDPDYTKNMHTYEILDIIQQQVNEINHELPIYQQIQMISLREKEFKKTASKKIKRYML